MSETIDFKCPSCGGKTFKRAVQLKFYKDFIGAPCNSCGAILSENEIKRQAGDVAAKALKQALKRSGR